MMNKNYLIFIMLSQLIILLVSKVINVNGQFILGRRVGHTAVLIGKKIYFIGGRNFNKDMELLSDFFSYDLGPGLSGAELTDLRNQQGISLPYVIWHTANIGGINQDSIFIIGGVGVVNDLVYRFDTNTNKLSTPLIQGITPPRREDMDSVSYEGKIYMFGGRMIDNNNKIIIYNNFDILDTVNLVWNVGSSVDAPPPRFHYTATLVNGVIYYIGGKREELNTIIYILMSNIYQYDIATDTWSLKRITIGDVPEPRVGHSAVLIGDKICVYGGINAIGVSTSKPSVGTIALLDTTTLTWSTPQLENINTPKLIDTDIPKLVYHTATLIDNLMFVAFGNFSDSVPRVSNENYYIFNLENLGQPKIQWFKLAQNDIGNPNANIPNINTLNTPNNPNTPNTSSPSGSKNANSATVSVTGNEDQKSPNLVVIGLSGGLAVIGLGTIVAFSIIYRRMKNQNSATGGEIDSDISADGGVILQIPSDADSLQHSPTPTFSQSQGSYSPGQEYSTLPLSQQERFSKRTSNYFPGCETPP